MTTDRIGLVDPWTTVGREQAGSEAELAAARHRVSAFLGATVDADGGVRRPCSSRTLESALLLVLLRRRDSHPEQVRRLAAYLAAPQAQVTGFETALAQAVLHGRTTATDVVGDELLAGFDHFSLTRKRLLFDVHLAVTGAISFDQSMLRPPRTTAPDDGADNSVSWIELIMLSVRVLVAHGLGRTEEISYAEQHRLLTLLGSSRAPVWENYPMAHLLALLAVEHFAPEHPLVDSGVTALLASCNPDGGAPSIADLHVFTTGCTGLALARAKAEPALLRRLCDYLVRQQLPDGGWSFGENMRHTDMDASAYAAACLATVDPVRHRTTLGRAAAYFRGMAGSDGGFPTYMRGDPSEVGMTGGALSALPWREFAPGGLPEDAARWLLDAQHADGTFERSWSLSEANTVWRAMWALHSLPDPTRTALHRRITAANAASLRFLARAQNRDGGWGHRPGDPSDVTSTCYSLLALSAMGRRPDHDPIVRAGVAHLLSRQDRDGTFTAPPDQVAPRPLLFDAPVFTDIWVLLALTSCDTDWNW
ncbi:hypothetical protein OHT77_40625 [Streptomyces sp. NBC_00252]|uniref:prenyltransferase/squalene oxidase repeat-containing protein n=1 Tax=Streptomyces sp. NBC_00252 TaxID=2975691 RepID=UPI002E2E4746|nr:prenyltransferase/squalene oxidase repeat-containing protein [Streptomyces sp. NBC_00252]